MAASALVQAKNLIFWAGKQAIASNATTQQVLDALTLAVGGGFVAGGGRLVTASVNGKSFSYLPDPDLSASDLMEALVEADAQLATYSTDEIAARLRTPRSSWGRVGFC